MVRLALGQLRASSCIGSRICSPDAVLSGGRKRLLSAQPRPTLQMLIREACLFALLKNRHCRRGPGLLLDVGWIVALLEHLTGTGPAVWKAACCLVCRGGPGLGDAVPD